MGETRERTDLATTEQRIMRMKLPDRYSGDSPRVCLLQIRSAETSTTEVEAKRLAIEDTLYWDYEDYDEENKDARPEGTDPKADVLVCGIGGCTLKIFLALDGSEIRTGECKAAGYCLRDKFKAVGSAATIEEGRALYKEIIDTCDGASGSMGAGNFCPKLNCDLSAGVSEDQVPGTHGSCAVRNLVQIEGFDTL